MTHRTTTSTRTTPPRDANDLHALLANSGVLTPEMDAIFEEMLTERLRLTDLHATAERALHNVHNLRHLPREVSDALAPLVAAVKGLA